MLDERCEMNHAADETVTIQKYVYIIFVLLRLK